MFTMPLINDQFVGANKDQQQVHSHHVNCEIFGKLCLSIAGLKRHERKQAQTANPHHNIHVSSSHRQCPVCGKICRHLEGLRVHTT